MSVTFLLLEQTITISTADTLQTFLLSLLQIFILIFKRKKNRGGFLFGMETCRSKLSSQYISILNLEFTTHYASILPVI